MRVPPTATARRARADQLRLYVCNNDQSVRVFALAAMRPLARIATPTPSNYCALAPGGGLLACVGDAPDRGAPAVYLYRPTPAGALARPVQPLQMAFSPCATSAHPADMPRSGQHAMAPARGVVEPGGLLCLFVPKGGQYRSHEQAAQRSASSAQHAAGSRRGARWRGAGVPRAQFRTRSAAACRVRRFRQAARLQRRRHELRVEPERRVPGHGEPGRSLHDLGHAHAPGAAHTPPAWQGRPRGPAACLSGRRLLHRVSIGHVTFTLRRSGRNAPRQRPHNSGAQRASKGRWCSRAWVLLRRSACAA